MSALSRGWGMDLSLQHLSYRKFEASFKINWFGKIFNYIFHESGHLPDKGNPVSEAANSVMKTMFSGCIQDMQ